MERGWCGSQQMKKAILIHLESQHRKDARCDPKSHLCVIYSDCEQDCDHRSDTIREPSDQRVPQYNRECDYECDHPEYNSVFKWPVTSAISWDELDFLLCGCCDGCPDPNDTDPGPHPYCPTITVLELFSVLNSINWHWRSNRARHKLWLKTCLACVKPR